MCISGYKFYALFAALRESWVGSNLLNESTNVQRRVSGEVANLLEDEEKWVHHIEKISKVLDDKISEQGLETREQIRDYIRTDTALAAFIEKTYGKQSK